MHPTSALILCFLTGLLTSSTNGLNITILHTNDVHSRFVPFDERMKLCNPGRSTECYGGAARRVTLIKKLRDEHKNVVLLDGGDQFQGTLWYTVLKWKPIAKLLNTIKYDVMAFGNHEFDDGLITKDEKLGDIGLVPYLKAMDSPFVASNLEADNSEIKDMFKRYHILEVDGEQIGVVGYVTPETAAISRSGPNIRFLDEVESLKIVVRELNNLGINKLIALGHSGFTVDKSICKEVPGVDIVIGGHTNTFLYAGQEPTRQKAEGPYPTVIDNVGGSKCLVVQDYAFGKYLGFLQVEFDDSGAVIGWSGNPILITSEFEEDQDTKNLLEPYQKVVDEYQKTVIGTTAVALNGDRMTCRLKECNFGNLIADAMIFSYLKRRFDKFTLDNPEIDTVSSPKFRPVDWAPSAIALVNSASFRDFELDAWSPVTMADLYNTIPYANTVELVRLRGKHIWAALEHSVKDIEKMYDDPAGKFLQLAGLKVQYDLLKPNGKRVSSVQVKCSLCAIPSFTPLQMERAYNVVTIAFLKKGGDGYNMISDNLLHADGLETLDIDVVADYIKARSPLTIGLEGRIKYSNETTCLANGARKIFSADQLIPFVSRSSHVVFISISVSLAARICKALTMLE